ncbi:MAG: hypothetical protein AAGF83_10245 [Cyanobacteria bacterium P01_G01_bin.67]
MFKLSLIGSFLALAVAASFPVKAQAAPLEPVKSDSYGVTPRELISLARHGRFTEQGIPSHNNFRSGVRTGKITAEELVASAIANKRLSAEVASDRQYLSAVENHLKSGGCGS